jgi:transcriptional regulator with XRE-family HTH domain
MSADTSIERICDNRIIQSTPIMRPSLLRKSHSVLSERMARTKQKKDIRLPDEARLMLAEGKARGLSQAAIGSFCGLDQDQISKIQTEKRQITAEEFVKIARGLGMWNPLPQTEAAPEPPQPWLPTTEQLAKLLAFAMHVVPDGPDKQGRLEVVAGGIGIGLKRLSKRPERADDPGYWDAIRDEIEEAIASVQSDSSR